MTSPEQQLVLERVGRGRYVLAGSPSVVELQMSGWRSRGEAVIGRESFVLRSTGLFARGVSVVDADGAEVLRLARKNTLVPPLVDCTWQVRSRRRGYEATLASPQVGSITFRLGYGGRSGVTADVVGTWPQRDLIVLAGAFAVLLRRRDDTSAGASVVASTAAIS